MFTHLKKYDIIVKKFVRFSFLRSLIGEGGDRVTDFEQLYSKYFNDGYRYILRLSGNEHIAEDITSDTFFKAMKSIDGFRGDCDVRVWLCQIAQIFGKTENWACVTYHRTRKMIKERLEEKKR